MRMSHIPPENVGGCAPKRSYRLAHKLCRDFFWEKSGAMSAERLALDMPGKGVLYLSLHPFHLFSEFCRVVGHRPIDTSHRK